MSSRDNRAAGRSRRSRGNRRNRDPTPPPSPLQDEPLNANEVLQGLARLVQAVGQGDVRRPTEVDRFPELYRAFSGLRPHRSDGTGGFTTAENWLEDVKQKFTLCRAPEEFKTELATQFLNGHARFWWHEAKRTYEGGAASIPWEWFVEQFTAKYLDAVSCEALRNQFMELKQGGMSVRDFNVKFDNLLRYAPDVAERPYRVREHYLKGLKPKFAQFVDHPGNARLIDLMQHALKIEIYETEMAKEKAISSPRTIRPRLEESSLQPQTSQPTYRWRPSQQLVVQPTVQSTQQPVFTSQAQPTVNKPSPLRGIVSVDGAWCDRCQAPHDVAFCRRINNWCFNCGKSGHYARNCPEPSTRRFVPYAGNERGGIGDQGVRKLVGGEPSLDTNEKMDNVTS